MGEDKLYKLIGSDGKQCLSTEKGLFGGNKELKIYGRLDCRSALYYILRGQYVKNRVFFMDEQTAIDAGYRPCGVCMREEYLKWKEEHPKVKKMKP